MFWVIFSFILLLCEKNIWNESLELSRNLLSSHNVYCISDFQFKFFDRYGRKNGFTCYVLRYFLVLNKDYNLHITLNELMVAIAMLFHKLELPRYQSLNIAPTSRCVTMFNWLQVSSEIQWFEFLSNCPCWPSINVAKGGQERV